MELSIHTFLRIESLEFALALLRSDPGFRDQQLQVCCRFTQTDQNLVRVKRIDVAAGIWPLRDSEFQLRVTTCASENRNRMDSFETEW